MGAATYCRSKIKASIFNTLDSASREIRHAAANVLTKLICFVERELLGELLKRGTSAHNDSIFKQVFLETVTFIFQEKCISKDEVSMVLASVMDNIDISVGY